MSVVTLNDIVKGYYGSVYTLTWDGWKAFLTLRQDGSGYLSFDPRNNYAVRAEYLKDPQDTVDGQTGPGYLGNPVEPQAPDCLLGGLPENAKLLAGRPALRRLLLHADQGRHGRRDLVERGALRVLCHVRRRCDRLEFASRPFTLPLHSPLAPGNSKGGLQLSDLESVVGPPLPPSGGPPGRDDVQEVLDWVGDCRALGRRC